MTRDTIKNTYEEGEGGKQCCIFGISRNVSDFVSRLGLSLCRNVALGTVDKKGNTSYSAALTLYYVSWINKGSVSLAVECVTNFSGKRISFFFFFNFSPRVGESTAVSYRSFSFLFLFPPCQPCVFVKFTIIGRV